MTVEQFWGKLNSFFDKKDNLTNGLLSKNLIAEMKFFLDGKKDIRLSGYRKVAASEPANRASLVAIINDVLRRAFDMALSTAIEAISDQELKSNFFWEGDPILAIKLAKQLEVDSKLRKIIQSIVDVDREANDIIEGRAPYNEVEHKDNFKEVNKKLLALEKKIFYLDSDLKAYIKSRRYYVGKLAYPNIYPNLNRKQYDSDELVAISDAVLSLIKVLTPVPIFSKGSSSELNDAIASLQIISKILLVFALPDTEKQTRCRICYRHASSSGLCRRHKLTKGANNQVAYNRGAKISCQYDNRVQELAYLHSRLSYGVESGFAYFDPSSDPRDDEDIDNGNNAKREEYDPISNRGILFTRIFYLVADDIGEHALEKMSALLSSFHDRIFISKVESLPTPLDFWSEWYSECIDDPLGSAQLRGEMSAKEIAMDLLRFRAWNEVGGNALQIGRGRPSSLDHEQIVALHAKGKSLREIAATVGSGSPERIRQIINSYKQNK